MTQEYEAELAIAQANEEWRKEFYQKVAEILGQEHSFNPRKRWTSVDRETGEIRIRRTDGTRWAGRDPGNGRFPGFGVIRAHNPGNIFVMSRFGQKVFETEEEALSFVKNSVPGVDNLA